MPHCIIEYAKTLENQVKPATVVNAVFLGAFQSNLFKPEDIKTRAMAFEHHQTGHQKQNFIHVTMKILAGRDQQQRTMLAEKVLAELNKMNLKSISLTVEVVAIEAESYAKLVK